MLRNTFLLKHSKMHFVESVATELDENKPTKSMLFLACNILSQNSFIMSKELFQKFSQLEKDDFALELDRLVKNAQELNGVKKYRALDETFNHGEYTYEELVSTYLAIKDEAFESSVYSVCEDYDAFLASCTDTGMTVISLCEQEEFERQVVSALCNKVTMNDELKNDIFSVIDSDFLSNCTIDAINEIIEKSYGKIPNKEIAAVWAAYANKNGVYSEFLMSQLNNPTSVLSYLHALSGGDGSLSKNVKFKSMPRSERKEILEKLNSMNLKAEDMVRYREEWKRVGERLHPGEYKNAYPKAYAEFTRLRSDESILTYEGMIDKCLNANDVKGAVDLLSERPAFLLRKLSSVLHKCNDELCDYVLDAYNRVANKIDYRVLVQAYNRYANNSLSIRTVSGINGGGVVSMKTEKSIPDKWAEDICTLTKNAIKTKGAADKSLKKIYIDDCDSLKIPSNVRNSSSALKFMASGSRFKMREDSNRVRFFLFWNSRKECKPTDDDIDLSVVLLSDSLMEVETISYTDLKSRCCDAEHSGDIRSSGDDGACEFVDFTIDRARKAGIRYVYGAVNSFSGEAFSTLEECFCGVMDISGDDSALFVKEKVKNKINLTSDVRMSINAVIDLETKEIIVVDKPCQRNSQWHVSGSSLESETMIAMESVFDNGFSIGELLRLKYSANGLVVSNKDEADIIVSDTMLKSSEAQKVVSPYNIIEISNLIFN